MGAISRLEFSESCRENRSQLPSDWTDRVVTCIRDAGWTLVRLRTGGHSLGYRLNSLETMIDEEEQPPAPRDRPPREHPPMAWEIDHMDHVLTVWLPKVPNVVHRRVLAYRMLYDSERERYLLSLREIGRRLHCSPPAVQYWYEKAVAELACIVGSDRNEILLTLLYVSRRTGLYSR